MKKYILLLFTLFLIGCGADSKQVEELKASNEILKKQLEEQAKIVAQLDGRVKKLQSTQAQFHKMIENMRRGSQNQKVNQMKAQQQVQQQKVRKADMRKQAHHMMRSLSRSRKPEQIAEMLNQRKILDLNGKSWTKQSVYDYQIKTGMIKK